MKVQVTLYHRNGAGSYGVADDEGLLSPQECFEEAHRIAWAQWLQSFGGTAPASTAIDPAPLRTDANLRAARIAPLTHTTLASRVPTPDDDEDLGAADKTRAFMEDLRCFLDDTLTYAREGDLHAARGELRNLIIEALDLDATLAHHQSKDR